MITDRLETASSAYGRQLCGYQAAQLLSMQYMFETLPLTHSLAGWLKMQNPLFLLLLLLLLHSLTSAARPWTAAKRGLSLMGQAWHVVWEPGLAGLGIS